MTTNKAFKRVVRARMAKTGERYAAARRALVEGATDGHHAEPTADAATPPGYRMRGGLHPETATLANVLANQGVVSGVTGEPLTEAAILGIGGGLGAGYILWEFQAEHRGKIHRGPVLTLGFRNQWQYPWIPGWTGKTLDRLGIEPDVHETGGAKGAREALDARLDAGVPVIAYVDLQSIGIWGQPDDLSGHDGLVVIVFGRDADGSYLVDDRGRAPFRVAPAVMAAARGRIGSFKHRIVGLRTTPGPIPAERLRAAMRAGLEDQVDHLRSPSDSFSLPAWRKWGRLMTDERNAKAWPRVFADGHGLFGSLSAIHEMRRRPGRAIGRAPARAVCRVARRSGRRPRQPRARRRGTGMAGRRRPMGGAGRCGRPARSRRCSRGGRGDGDASRGGDGRRTGTVAVLPRPRRPPGRSGIATPTPSPCHPTASLRSSRISATGSARSTRLRSTRST